MADTQTDTTNPAGADIGALINPPAGLTAGLADINRAKIEKTEKVYDDTEKRLDQDQARATRAYDATGIGSNQLEPWDEQQQREKFHHEPLEAFGSLGSVVGLLGAAFVHAPMEAGLNASAAAMNAIKAGDDQGYERAFAAHKFNTDLVVKRHDMMRESYSDAITLMQTDMRAGEAKLQMEAARFGDRKVQFLLDNGQSEELYKMMDARSKAVEGMAKAADAINESMLKKNAYDGTAKGIDAAAKQAEQETGQPVDPMETAARKLQAFNRIYKTKTDTPAQEILGTYLAQHPMATAEELAKFADEHHLIPNYGAGAASLGKMDAQHVMRQAQKYAADPDGPEYNDPDAAYARARKESKQTGALLDNDTLKTMAEQYIAGDKSVFQNLGRGAQGAENVVKLRNKVMEVAKEQGLEGQDLALRMAEFSGLMSGQRALGTRAANIEMFANETLNMIAVARKKSEEVPRSEWVPVNRALQSFERNTGDPRIRGFGAAINSLVNVYAKAIAGGGQATVSDKDHARELVTTADSPAQFEEVMSVIEMELKAAKAAPGQVKQQFRELATDKNLGNIPSAAPAGGIIKYDKEGNRVQ